MIINIVFKYMYMNEPSNDQQRKAILRKKRMEEKKKEIANTGFTFLWSFGWIRFAATGSTSFSRSKLAISSTPEFSEPQNLKQKKGQ